MAADSNPCKENLDAYVKKIVSSLPPLTGSSDGLLGMIDLTGTALPPSARPACA